MSQINETSNDGCLTLYPGDLQVRQEIETAVFLETDIISTQPQRESEFPITRRPIPVSTINWTTTPLNQFTPITGLDFLIGADQVNIQQTVELHDMLANVESENRYTVKVPQGETLYLASETSTQWERICFGSSRSFEMVLHDQTRQEALKLTRRLACSNFLFGCYLQDLQVLLPTDEIIGYVKQEWTLTAPVFTVKDAFNVPLYRIEGPAMCPCTIYKDCAFTIFTADSKIQLSSIRHQWDQLMVGYNLSVYFPERSTNATEKALLLAAGFLLEYMYFERAKSNSCRCCC